MNTVFRASLSLAVPLVRCPSAPRPNLPRDLCCRITYEKDCARGRDFDTRRDILHSKPEPTPLDGSFDCRRNGFRYDYSLAFHSDDTSSSTRHHCKLWNNQSLPVKPFPQTMEGKLSPAVLAALPHAQDEVPAMSAESKNRTPPPPSDETVCANYLKALGDPVRLQIVRALQAGPLSVSDLSQLLDLELANVSHHLRVLFHAELVTTEREGKYIYYRLNQHFLKNRSPTKAFDFGCCQIDLGSHTRG